MDEYLGDHVEVIVVLKDVVFLGIYNQLVFLKKLKRIRLLIAIVVFILFKDSLPKSQIVLIFLCLQRLDGITNVPRVVLWKFEKLVLVQNKIFFVEIIKAIKKFSGIGAFE